MNDDIFNQILNNAANNGNKSKAELLNELNVLSSEIIKLKDELDNSINNQKLVIELNELDNFRNEINDIFLEKVLELDSEKIIVIQHSDFKTLMKIDNVLKTISKEKTKNIILIDGNINQLNDKDLRKIGLRKIKRVKCIS